MITKFSTYLKENWSAPYVTFKGNLYDYFENLGIEVNIIQEDRQTLQLEFDKKLTGKEDWLSELCSFCIENDYDKFFIEGNVLNLSSSLGVIYKPNEYQQFDD